jgi:hypothetical protein
MTDRREQLKGRQVFDIAMPGTHNSGIFAWPNTIGVRNQDADIAAQLNGGIRVFDIRVMTLNGVYMMHHSEITGSNLGSST